MGGGVLPVAVSNPVESLGLNRLKYHEKQEGPTGRVGAGMCTFKPLKMF